MGLLMRLHNMSLTVLSVELSLPHETGERPSVRWDDM